MVRRTCLSVKSRVVVSGSCWSSYRFDFFLNRRDGDVVQCVRFVWKRPETITWRRPVPRQNTMWITRNARKLTDVRRIFRVSRRISICAGRRTVRADRVNAYGFHVFSNSSRCVARRMDGGGGGGRRFYSVRLRSTSLESFASSRSIENRMRRAHGSVRRRSESTRVKFSFFEKVASDTKNTLGRKNTYTHATDTRGFHADDRFRFRRSKRGAGSRRGGEGEQMGILDPDASKFIREWMI